MRFAEQTRCCGRPLLAALLLCAGACSGSGGSQDQSSVGAGGSTAGGSSVGVGGSAAGGAGGGWSFGAGGSATGGSAGGSSVGVGGSAAGGAGGGWSFGAGGNSGSGGASPSDGGSPSDAGCGPDVWSSPVDGGPKVTGPSVAGTVTVNPGATTGQIPPRFAGLSYEKSHITDGFLAGSNAPLVAMLKLLGPNVLRLDGNSVDYGSWQASALPVDGGKTSKTIGTADVDNLRDLLAATDWTVIYGVGLRNTTPEAAAAEAGYVATTLGPLLYGFEPGNEPEFYGWTAPQLYANWSAEANAIRTAAPGAKLVGPANAWLPGVAEFAAAEASLLSMLSVHHYIGPPGNMTTMLRPTDIKSFCATMATSVSSNHIADGWRMDETNSFYGHGSPGVSNAFGAALWALDYIFAHAIGGAAGLNFHGGGAGQDGATTFHYTPIGEIGSVVTDARPLFYGMLMFSLAGTGQVLQTTATMPKVLAPDAAIPSALNFGAYAVGRPDGTMSVVLVNKDATYAVHASVDVGVAASSASAIYLEGPSLDALTGITLAGAPVTPAGDWAPAAPITLAISGRVITVDVPAASAALVRVR